MKAKDAGALLVLSALWGGSFFFIRIAVPVLGPVVLMELRVLVAGIALLLYSLALRRNLDVRKRWRQYLIIGIINSALPFTLIATAELHLTVGLAAILNATSPLFGAIVAALWIKEALTRMKVIGLLLGLVGVGVVVGWNPLPFSVTLVLSSAASLAAAACYGLAGVYIKVSMQGSNPGAVATCSQLGAAMCLFPVIFVVPAQHLPSLPVILAVATLALVCTAFAYLIYFSLIETVGPTKALTVTFLAPAFGVLWGVIFLSEALTLSTILGFGVILLGTGFVTGVVRFRFPDRDKLLEQQQSL